MLCTTSCRCVALNIINNEPALRQIEMKYNYTLAEKCNDYYATSTRGNIPPSSKSFTEFLNISSIYTTLALYPTSPEEILDISRPLRLYHSAAIDVLYPNLRFPILY